MRCRQLVPFPMCGHISSSTCELQKMINVCNVWAGEERERTQKAVELSTKRTCGTASHSQRVCKLHRYTGDIYPAGTWRSTGSGRSIRSVCPGYSSSQGNCIKKEEAVENLSQCRLLTWRSHTLLDLTGPMEPVYFFTLLRSRFWRWTFFMFNPAVATQLAQKSLRLICT